MQTAEQLEARQVVSRPSHEQALTEKAVPTALAQFVRRQGALRSEVTPVYADHVAALDEAAPVGAETLKDDARIQVQLDLGAAFRWIFFEDAWRALADDRKALKLRRSVERRASAWNCVAVPTIDLPDDELAAVTAAIRGVIEGDRYPQAPRLDPLRAAWRGSTRRWPQSSLAPRPRGRHPSSGSSLE
jgi:hypothetical protein